MIEKTLIVSGKEVTFRASATIPRIYRAKFKRDIFKDLTKLEKSYKDREDGTREFIKALNKTNTKTGEVKVCFAHTTSKGDNKGETAGVPSGFIDLDGVTNGFKKSDLILIAARPSMGKTAFALNIALNAALAKKVVAVFSLEMSKEQLGQRLLSIRSGIDSLKMSTGNLSEDEIVEVADTVDELAGTNLFIDDTAAISVLELRSKARRLKNERGLDMLVIDYLQLMQGSKASSKGTDFNRQQEISDISRSLKALARELKIPVIALSQLSRNVELRADKRPLLSDLRESGSLEQDADIVMFLYREEYYNQETENVNQAEVIIAKNRNGPTQSIKLQFTKECMRFATLAYEEEPQ